MSRGRCWTALLRGALYPAALPITHFAPFFETQALLAPARDEEERIILKYVLPYCSRRSSPAGGSDGQWYTTSASAYKQDPGTRPPLQEERQLQEPASAQPKNELPLLRGREGLPRPSGRGLRTRVDLIS
jgi:hypothetical protein